MQYALAAFTTIKYFLSIKFLNYVLNYDIYNMYSEIFKR